MSVAVEVVQRSDLGSRVAKVNHAGEHGADCIYTAQIFFGRITAPSLVPELVEFRSHERRHRELFQKVLLSRARPRCRSYLLCGLGGFVLGAITSVFGTSAIAATTVAVEAVVLRHLEQQVETLKHTDPDVVAAIASIIAEERLHHDQSQLHAKAGTFWPRLLAPIVSASTELVIWSGMRL
jgi:ubiquinone biosynthesis monooxygenase Coq7